MILLQKDKVVTDKSGIAKTLNGYFRTVVKSIKILESQNIDQETPTLKRL